MGENKEKNCPICSSKMSVSVRYPNMICHECSEKTLNEKGDIHECFVKGYKCYADEARFGGIVIQLSQ